MEKIKVLIADDSVDFATLMKQNLEFNGQIEVVGMAKDGLEAVEMTKTLQPDVLILDIIMPNLDGVGTLEKLQEENINVKTVMLSAILSSDKQEKLSNLLLSLGADYVVTKPFDIDSLISRICQLVNKESQEVTNIYNTNNASMYFTNVNTSNVYNSNALFKEESFETKVTNIMHTVGIPAKLKGYQYIREAILLFINNGDATNKITKDIYPKIAEKFNTTPTRVERAIRHALEISWEHNKAAISSLIFGNPFITKEKRPTNSEFIASIADKLRLEAKQYS